MSTLAIGTTIAATDAMQARLEEMTGGMIPAQFGRGVIIGSTEVPANLLTGNPEIDDNAEAYVVQPQDGDGNDLGEAEGLGDVAFTVVRVPEQYGSRAVASHPELGEVPVVITVGSVVKSVFLASAEVRDTATVDQFTAALNDDDGFDAALANLLGVDPADVAEWDPEACDDDEPGSDFTD